MLNGTTALTRKEVRLAGISTIAEANRFLQKRSVPKMHRTFSRPAAQPQDAHLMLGTAHVKDRRCLEYQRTVANNDVIRFETSLFHILTAKKALPRPKDNVLVRIRLDGSISIRWKKPNSLLRSLLLHKSIKPKKQHNQR